MSYRIKVNKSYFLIAFGALVLLYFGSKQFEKSNIKMFEKNNLKIFEQISGYSLPKTTTFLPCSEYEDFFLGDDFHADLVAQLDADAFSKILELEKQKPELKPLPLSAIDQKEFPGGELANHYPVQFEYGGKTRCGPTQDSPVASKGFYRGYAKQDKGIEGEYFIFDEERKWIRIVVVHP